MNFSIEDLESLANWLEKLSEVAKAKMSEFGQLGDKENVNRQADRAIKLGRYVDTCREAARRLRVRASRKQFTPPTLDDVLNLAREVGWPTADAEEWYDHFQSNGWKVSGKTVMSDWRAAARNGFRRWQRNNTQRKVTKENIDPPRWRYFLDQCKLPRQFHAHALQHIKDEFQKWLKANP